MLSLRYRDQMDVECRVYSYAESAFTDPASGLFRCFFTPHKRARPQRCEKFVGCFEASRSQLWNNDRFNSFEFRGGVRADVHFGGLNAGMSEPKRDFSEVL